MQVHALFCGQAFKKRFTESSIQRVAKASKILQNVVVTNTDYKNLLNGKGDNTFLFLDPPYMSNAEAKLYGEKGRLYSNFRHKRFANNVEKCKHKWLITYNYCSGIRQLYNFANAIEINIQGWKLQYGTNNGTANLEKKNATIGKELFIFNYEIKADNK